MKVLILNPPSFDQYQYIKEGRCESRKGVQLTPPITLGIVASLLKQNNISLDFYDLMIEHNKLEEIVSKKYDIAFINVSAQTLQFDIKTAAIIKKSNKNIIIIALGVLATALPETLLEHNVFDITVLKEPELTALDICKSFIKHKKLSLKNLLKIKGICFRIKDKVYKNKGREFINNLDTLPFPDRDLMPTEKYINPKTGKPFTVIKIGRGCPYSCTFCTSNIFYGKKARYRTVANVAKEIKEVIDNYNINDFAFLSDTFTANKSYVQELCKEIIKNNLKIKWVCNSRVNTIDIETALLMKKAGCYLIAFGAESGSKNILKNIKKDIIPQQVIEAAKICRKAKIISVMYYILGFPDETLEDMDATIKLALKTDSDFARFFTATPLPGSEFFNNFIDKIKIKDLNKLNLADCSINFSAIEYGEIRKLIRKANTMFYLRPKQIYRLFVNFNIKELPCLIMAGSRYLRVYG